MPISAKHLSEIDKINKMFIHRDNWGDLFEEITFNLYSAVLGPGDAAADCGTNHGLHTRSLARCCGPEGRVFAFEAAPEMMARTVTATQSFSNIIFFQNAVWCTAGETLNFNFYPHEDGLSGLRVRDGATAHVPLEVTTITLDQAIDTPVSLIKLDIEGAEFNALQGATRIMSEDRPVIVFENGRSSVTEAFKYSKEEFFRLFEDHGYFLYSIAGMPLVRENWDAMMPWQFIALHPVSPRLSRAFAATQTFLYRLCSN